MIQFSFDSETSNEIIFLALNFTITLFLGPSLYLTYDAKKSKGGQQIILLLVKKHNIKSFSFIGQSGLKNSYMLGWTVSLNDDFWKVTLALTEAKWRLMNWASNEGSVESKGKSNKPHLFQSPLIWGKLRA